MLMSANWLGNYVLSVGNARSTRVISAKFGVPAHGSRLIQVRGLLHRFVINISTQVENLMTLLSEIYQLTEVVKTVDPSLDLEQQLEILERRIAAAKRGLGFSNKLKNPAQRKKHIALVLTNLNKIRANLARVIAEISEVNGQFDKAEQGYEAGMGYDRAVGESQEIE